MCITLFVNQAVMSYNVKLNLFFIIFRGLSIAKNCLRPDSEPLMLIWAEAATGGAL